MLALWALFLLAAMVVSWALDINSQLAISGNANRVLEAEAMAASGAEVSLAREISPDSPNLHRQMADRQSYDVQMTGECGRINLNWLIQGEDPTKLDILKRYLSLKGIELNDVDRMVDSLLDWVERNQGLKHLNACPESDDYHPPHAGRLFTVDELKKVCGWADFTARPNWDEDFTVVGSCGAIDLAWASRDVLRALGIGDDHVDRFLQLRRGEDGIDGTADDFQFSGGGATQLPAMTNAKMAGSAGGTIPVEVQSALGLTPDQLKQLQPLIQFNSPVFRVVSVGRSGNVTRTVQMIISKANLGGRPQVISWKEL